MVFIITLSIGYGAVLKSSSQWQLRDSEKKKKSWTELLTFKILLIAID